MRLTLAFLLLPAVLLAQRPKLGPQARAYVSVDTPVVALSHVRVIDGTGAPAKEDQTVLIEEGRIKTVGQAGSVNPRDRSTTRTAGRCPGSRRAPIPAWR